MSPMTKQMGQPSVPPPELVDPEPHVPLKSNLATAASWALGVLLIVIVVASTMLSG